MNAFLKVVVVIVAVSGLFACGGPSGSGEEPASGNIVPGDIKTSFGDVYAIGRDMGAGDIESTLFDSHGAIAQVWWSGASGAGRWEILNRSEGILENEGKTTPSVERLNDTVHAVWQVQKKLASGEGSPAGSSVSGTTTLFKVVAICNDDLTVCCTSTGRCRICDPDGKNCQLIQL